eukprot:1158955-Pelagomonas_calceolata.AAC.15
MTREFRKGRRLEKARRRKQGDCRGEWWCSQKRGGAILQGSYRLATVLQREGSHEDLDNASIRRHMRHVALKDRHMNVAAQDSRGT